MNKPDKTGRGTRLGTRLLLFSTLFLLALPWLGYRYLEAVKAFLLQGQQDAQELAVRAIASVLNDRSDLFPGAVDADDPATADHTLFVYPLEAPLLVDGYSSDWGAWLNRRRAFGAAALVYDRTEGSEPPATFELLLGEHSTHLYGLVRVYDDNIVYRHPGYRRLDNSDQLRIELITPDGRRQRYVLLAEAPGNMSIYRARPDWKTFTSGQPVYDITAIWRERGDGYDIELRMPLQWFAGSKQLKLMVANVSSTERRNVEHVVATLPLSETGALNPLITRTPALDRILTGLEQDDASICVVDPHRRVRAVIGGAALDNRLCERTDTVSGELVAEALNGTPGVYNRTSETGEKLIVAAHPVYRDEAVIGAVLLEKNSARILGSQRESLLQIVIATSLVIAVFLFGLVLFGAWLAWRIRRLQRETARAIDGHGKLLQTAILADRHSPDELGELSRSFSDLLSRLGSYTGFLESVPRTLRHEILNPVNTISLSLQQLKQSTTARDAGNLLDGTEKAIRQLELIVQSLTEAAHIDDALRQDGAERFDLCSLVNEYVANSRARHTAHMLVYREPCRGFHVNGSDLRIVQLLDKLKDNALDFAVPDSEIEFTLDHEDGYAIMAVCNDGPVVPHEILHTLGQEMTSHRASESGRPHLGIGLYIATKIAQQHGGRLTVSNRDDGSGVCVRVALPLV